jgi:NDP-sugar pyrophosphorylase family protein
MKDGLNIKDFFDISDFPYPEIFKNKDIISPIRDLELFITNLFKSGKIKGNYKKAKNVYIGKGTKILDGALISGPAIIGKNCLIGHSSLLRGSCLLGDNVNIGHCVEVKNSIFLNNSTAAHLNYVGDSIIGNNVNISGGVIIANVRLDKKTIKIKANKIIDTSLTKFGSVVGDNSNVGVNSVLNPGTILGKNTVVFPLVTVIGVHKDNTVIKK